MAKSRCMQCMGETERYPCPHCGFEGQPQKNYALPYATVLSGRYMVGKVLGQGGFGLTYVGWDLALEQKVAIKEFFPSGQVMRNGATSTWLQWNDTPQSAELRQSGMESFLREARKMARIGSIPEATHVRDVFHTNDTAYIVMEFVEGRTLKDVLAEKGPLSWEEAKKIFLPAIRAMDQLHQAGIIHRDLSPDNLMIQPDGMVKILDLGAAKDLNVNSGASSMLVAKGGFSPMEQYTQRGGSGPWSDVYSMAATMYYTLTGVMPPSAIDRMDDDTLRWDLPRLQKIPPEGIRALQKAMLLRVKDRTQTMEELYRGIAVPSRKKAVRKKVIPAPPDKKPAKPEKKEKKWGKLLLPVGAVVACIAIAAAVMLGKPSGKTEESRAAAPTETTVPLSPEEDAYAEAEDLLAGGDRYDAAVAFYALGDYRDARERSFAIWEEITHRETVSVGEEHTVGLKADGTVVAVGYNKNGQCNVSSWTDIVAVSAGGYHTAGLKADGTVVAVGGNDWGQCDVSGWTDIVAVSAGGSHTVGLKADGTVMTVGKNEDGRCDISNWTDIVAVSAGLSHTVGLKADGTVVTVGNNDDGRCNVSNWTDIVAVSAGLSHTVGLKADGTVVAVGRNNNGQCNVSNWTDIVAVSAGWYHTIGLKADGTVVAVGSNVESQCNVSGWQDCVAVSAGSFHTVGIKDDGTVVAVRRNEIQSSVRLWTGIKLPTQTLPSRNNHKTTPEEENPSDQQTRYEKAEELLSAGETAKAAIAFGKLGDYRDARERSFAIWEEITLRDTIIAGSNHTVGLKSDGTVAAVGHNKDGQCNVSDWQDIVAVSAGWFHTVGLKADGTVVAAGNNDLGECDVNDWHDIVAVSAGQSHTVGLKADGTVVAVGNNWNGQCDVSDWQDIVAVSSGYAHTVGLKADGTVVAVGWNEEDGQCNVGHWTDIVAVSAGVTHTVGLKADGTVVAVGNNEYGQCNVGHWTDIVAVSAGGSHTVGLKADGTVVAVGSYFIGVCDVSSWTDVVAVSAGGYCTIGLKADGTVVADGYYGVNERFDVSGLTDIKIPNRPSAP